MKPNIPCLSLAILSFFSSAAAGTKPAEGAGSTVFLENQETKVAIDRSKGASITWLSFKDYPRNMVNIHDPGRLIQQSYYAGKRIDRTADGQSKAWSPWSWNPIQGGGVGSWARVVRLEKLENGTLFGETIPKLWDMPDEEAEAVMRQWTRFEPDMPDVVVVRNQLVANRRPDDRWGPTKPNHQEVPACYFTRNFDQFKIYRGDGVWESVTQKPGPPWGKVRPPHKAMACFNADGLGVAIFSPVSTEPWNFGPHVVSGSSDPSAGPCVHIAPISMVALGPQSTYEYRYWLVVGNEKQVAARLDELLKKYSAERGLLSDAESAPPSNQP